MKTKYVIHTALFVGVLFQFASLGVFAQNSSEKVYKIMPLGDSITHGVKDDVHGRAGYRYVLYKKLKEAGVKFDFVGSLKDGGSVDDPIDQDHEGHDGYKAGNDSTGILGQFVFTAAQNKDGIIQRYDPDIVLMMLGTNSLNSMSASVDDAIAQLSNLIDRILVIKPEITIVVASIPPRGQNTLSGVVESPLTAQVLTPYNNRIATLVQQKKAEGKKIYFSDNARVFTDLGNDMSSDFVHPATPGYDKMGAKFFETLMANNLVTETASYLRSDFGGKDGVKDGVVDIQDFNILVTEFYKTGTNLRTDIIKDTNNRVDINDYNAFVDDYLAYLAQLPK